MTVPHAPRDPRATIVLDPALTRAALAVTGVAVAVHALWRWRRGDPLGSPGWGAGEAALALLLLAVATRWRQSD